MPPAKRSLPKPEPVKSNIPALCYCNKCKNCGKEIAEMIYLCNQGVNFPGGNHSVIKCIKYLGK